MAYVYQHIRLDTDEVFYIGIGSDTEGKYIRAYKKNGRNLHWNHIVNKVGYRVEILKDGISWEEAYEEEKRFIKLYGRRNLNEGNLVNLTDGGDGTMGAIVSEETRLKLSELAKGRIISIKQREQISKVHKGKIISNEQKQKTREALKGKPLSEETKRKMSESNIGKTLSEETKRKISEFNIGKVLSKDTKQKMTEAKLLFWKIKKLNTKPPKPHQFF
jgi:hypothetical protein